LLAARHAAPGEDTHLVHVIRMALRNQLLPGTPWPKVGDNGGLSEADVRALADVAPGSHGPESAEFLLGYVKAYKEDDGTLSRYAHHVARYGTNEVVDGLVEFVRSSAPDNLVRQAGLLKSIQQGLQERGAPLPASAVEQGSKVADRLLGSKDPGVIAVGIDLASSYQVPNAKAALAGILKNRDLSEESRVAALTALVAVDARAADAPIREVLADAAAPLSPREKAAATLGGLNYAESRAALIEALPVAPSRLQTAIAVALAPTRPGAEALLNAIGEGKGSPRLLQERPVQVVLAGAGVADLDARLAKLTAGLPPAEERVQGLLAARKKEIAEHPGDPARGAAVFQKVCATCHQIGGEGAKVGPQLDGVGIRGADRLLEDVLDPNRNVDQAFRASNIAQKDGSLVSGLVLREEGEIVIIADAQGKEVRVPKDSIEERVVSALSPMPANLSEQIAEPEFRDLMAYLLSQKLKEK
jgi:putative heme-binding domain-containing protein